MSTIDFNAPRTPLETSPTLRPDNISVRRQRPLKQAVLDTGLSFREIAKMNDCNVADVSNFVSGKLKRIGRGRRETLRAFFLQRGIVTKKRRRTKTRIKAGKLVCGK